MSEPVQSQARLYPLGDRVVVVELGEDASEATALRVRTVSEHFLGKSLPGVLDVVPAVCTVALHYDPRDVENGEAEISPYAALAAQITQRLQGLETREAPSATTFEVPVCYGGAFGEDLESLAAARGLTADEVIALHSEPLYRVQMLGFAPGFAYLAGLDPRLATPRRASPRTNVPAGSVGIGGELTGVYPLDLPGGWQLIGRSPVRLFDPSTEPPTPFSMGDRVRFIPVSPEEFQRLLREGRWR